MGILKYPRYPEMIFVHSFMTIINSEIQKKASGKQT